MLNYALGTTKTFPNTKNAFQASISVTCLDLYLLVIYANMTVFIIVQNISRKIGPSILKY